MWKRWTREYVRSLHERHRQCNGKQTSQPKISDVVIVQDEEKNWNKWKLGVVNDVIETLRSTTRPARRRAFGTKKFVMQNNNRKNNF